ncbi:MAG: hypothetical protein ACLVK4_14470 [Alistipes shahii]|uniref:hypothetical protein n=1 Tax=Alistipes shahii TaxID=328814 RepID=UPI00399C77BD
MSRLISLRRELVEPVKPIVFYLDTNLPEAWKPYAREGIEHSRERRLREKIGSARTSFSARDYSHSREEDPEFDPDNPKYSRHPLRASRWRSRTPWLLVGRSPHGRDHHGVGDEVCHDIVKLPEPGWRFPANRSPPTPTSAR